MKRFLLLLTLAALLPLGRAHAQNPWDGARLVYKSPVINHLSYDVHALDFEGTQTLGVARNFHEDTGGVASTSWDLNVNDVLKREKGAPTRWEDAMFTFLPEQKTMLIRGAHFVQARDLDTGALRFTARIAAKQSHETSSLSSLAISPDKTRLAIGGQARVGREVTGRVRVFDLATGAPLGTWKLPASVSEVSWESDDRLSARGASPLIFGVLAPKGALRKTTLASEAPRSARPKTRSRRVKRRA